MDRKIMREVLINALHKRMFHNEKIFFLSADFGAPSLDKIRKDFPERFINTGIAEQNIINIATGLALEGFIPYVYGIAPFISMRCFEQIRNNLSLLAQTKNINVNIISVGAGVSYDVSGPSHHCVEDVSVIRTLPNVAFFSPSDFTLVEKYVDCTINEDRPKYLRLDGKPVNKIYNDSEEIDYNKGFYELKKSKELCLVSTGHMTHKALEIHSQLQKQNTDFGIIDIFMLDKIDFRAFCNIIGNYKFVISLEEGYIGCGGLDSFLSFIFDEFDINVKLKRLGLSHEYYFDNGGRDHIHKINGIDTESLGNYIKNLIG